jgi:hypothetical protein
MSKNRKQFLHNLKYKKEMRIINKEYIYNEFGKLIETDTMYGFNFSIYDGYGNKTKFLKCNAKQLEQIKNILTLE